MASGRIVLALNVGSSSCKFTLYDLSGDGEKLIADGAAERVGVAGGGRLWIHRADGRALADLARDLPRPQAAVDALLDEVERHKLPRPAAVGHRIVHGGPNHAAPERIGSKLIGDLRGLIPFAPLHMPGGIEGITATAARLPEAAQVACFDTAFHRTMPEVARRLPLPQSLHHEGVRRYGFHGISYEYIVAALGADLPRRLIAAHLGNGASAAAILDGKSVDTTMGFTPTGGFMMGSRTGDLDPGVVLYLMREKNYDAARLDDLVNHRSGLLGVSGVSSDVKALLAASADIRDLEKAQDARLAIDMFCYQIGQSIAAMAAALGGVDLIVFTGGIGEHAPQIRAGVCAGLAHLGVVLDKACNAANDGTISAAASRCEVRVIATNESLMIARHTRRIVFENG